MGSKIPCASGLLCPCLGFAHEDLNAVLSMINLRRFVSQPPEHSMFSLSCLFASASQEAMIKALVPFMITSREVEIRCLVFPWHTTYGIIAGTRTNGSLSVLAASHAFLLERGMYFVLFRLDFSSSFSNSGTVVACCRENAVPIHLLGPIVSGIQRTCTNLLQIHQRERERYGVRGHVDP